MNSHFLSLQDEMEGLDLEGKSDSSSERGLLQFNHHQPKSPSVIRNSLQFMDDLTERKPHHPDTISVR